MQTQFIDNLVGQKLGNYHIESFLGKGRLSAVYLARHRSLQRTDALALYIIPEHFSAEARNRFSTRFRREASAITKLNYPHILPIYEYGEQAGYPYLVTPYTMDGSLADMLKRKGRCEHSDVQSVLEQIVAGLDYAHTQGFVHGTLKPSNIVLRGDDTLQVAGFGLMHMLQISGIEQKDQPYAHLLSIAGTFLASPEYVAPEVVQGQSIDVRSDVYALGCILYELLSGQPPFKGSNPLEVATMHVEQPIPSLRTLCPDIPFVLVSVVNQALERDPTRRFQHASELGEAFTQASRGAQSHGHHAPGTALIAHTERLQETPPEGYPASNWQFMPPIVTGKIAAIKPSDIELFKNHDNSVTIPPGQIYSEARYFLPPGTTERKPPVKPAALTLPPASAPPEQRPPVRQVVPILPPASVASEQIPLVKSVAPEPLVKAKPVAIPRHIVSGDETDFAAYEWWSQPGSVNASLLQAESARPSQEPLRLHASEVTNWAVEPLMPSYQPAARRPVSMNKKPPRKFARRHVIALLATSGVAVAGAALALNFKAPGVTNQNIVQQPATNKAPQGATGNQPATQPIQAPKPTTPPQGGTGNQQPQPGNMTNNGMVIGSANMAKNSALDFVNPADKKPALLVRLPNGNLVAYEKACTHEGVSVGYDAATTTLVCPAHGAIFDPANVAKVLQGPANKPLTKVAIRVNNDGTITAA